MRLKPPALRALNVQEFRGFNGSCGFKWTCNKIETSYLEAEEVPGTLSFLPSMVRTLQAQVSGLVLTSSSSRQLSESWSGLRPSILSHQQSEVQFREVPLCFAPCCYFGQVIRESDCEES